MSDIKKVAVLGSGMVGSVLAGGFKELGYKVSIGSRDGKKVEKWEGEVGTFDQVSKDADLVVLAVRGDASEQVVANIKENIVGKILIDTTNPIDQTKPPVNGVLRYFTTLEESLAERLQGLVPETHVVKAFNSVGAAHMVHPKFSSTPSMFICGNDKESKTVVGEVIEKFGWDVEDMGMIEASRAIEPLCMLWCIPGFMSNDWNHGFKVVM
jgi:8-hydroxy-5-deazaflavin:NADPH oxidoreductase